MDASGRCQTTYQLRDTTHLTKTKRACTNAVPVDAYNQTNVVLGADVESQATAEYTLSPEDKVSDVPSKVSWR